jgi:anti-sigma factor RsiW
MTERDSPVTIDELHAYVDGLLPPDRRSAVEAWLSFHPDDAASVAEWRAQVDAIRAHYGAIADEPLSARFDLDRLARSSRSWRMAAAAAMLAAVIGGVAGWLAHGASAAAPTTLDTITEEALAAHRLYIAEVRHPIEVRAAEKHLVPWLSKRVGANIHAPDLQSYSLKLLGGRLLPGPIGPAALFMYETPSGERFTLYCSRSQSPHTALRYLASGDIAAMRWVEGQVGFVMSGPADRDRLAKIAQSVYEQMENVSPAHAEMSSPVSRKGS